MRIALAQINTTVGDIAGNAALIVDRLEHAARAGATLVVFPEMAVSGYPPRDLLLRSSLVADCEAAVARIAAACPAGVTAVIGSPRRHGREAGRGVANSAAIVRRGEVEAWYDKRLLPTYDVFDEWRYFDAGTEPCVFVHEGRRLGVTICEDLWRDDPALPRRYVEDPVADLLARGIDGLINVSASPFVAGKPAFRERLFGRVAKRAGAWLACCNLAGGNDELIFDGHSALLNRDGEPVTRAAGFDEDFLVIDVDERAPVLGPPDRLDVEEIFEALILGMRDYLRKTGFRDAILGLSGGIDSALVAVLACAALGPGHVRAVGMPSRYSSRGSIDDSRALAARLGMRFDLVPIEPAHAAMLDMLAPIFNEVGAGPSEAEENIQARLRGNVLMSLSNKTGAILLTTGNKSELAVGYCTLYGDMAGGLAVLSDVPKTTVYRLSRWINANPRRVGVDAPPIPEAILTKPPSAELRPNQTDQDTLPPYDVLDRIVEAHVERNLSPEEIIEQTGIDAETVRAMCRRIDRNEYKRQQMPVGLKVTGRAFGYGWRMPIAARFR